MTATESSLRLDFNAELHEYKVDGRVIPSVTEILRSNIQTWNASEWHLSRGSAVHLAVKLALENRLDRSSLDPRITGREGGYESELFGNCVVCGRYLGEAEYNQQQVVAAIGAEGTVVVCVSHVDGGPANPEYKSTLDKIVLAKAAQLQKN